MADPEKKRYKLSVKLSVTFFSEQSVGMTLAQRYDWSGTPLSASRALPRRIYRLPPMPPTSIAELRAGRSIVAWPRYSTVDRVAIECPDTQIESAVCVQIYQCVSALAG